MSSWRARLRERKQLRLLRRLQPVLLVLQAQQDRLDLQELRMQELASLLRQTLEHLQPLPEDLRMQGILLMEQREISLELLQATVPTAEEQVSRAVGPLLPPS